MKKRLCFGVCLVLGGVLSATATGVRYIAHRGESMSFPENTMRAFTEARNRGADGFECDIYLTADNKIVCIHDPTTGRTCVDAEGDDADLTVADSTLAELLELDAGFKKREDFEGERIPTLAEALTLVDSNFEVFVEIKVGTEIIPELQSVMSGVPAGLLSKVRFIAFNSNVIKAVRQSFPQCEAYWLLGSGSPLHPNLTPDPAGLLATLSDIDASGVDMQNHASLSSEYIAAIKGAGYSFHVWTVNDYNRAAELTSLGVDSITSDVAASMRTIYAPQGQEVEPLIHWTFEGGSTANLGTGGSAYDAILSGAWDIVDGVDGDAIHFSGGVRGYAAAEHTLGEQGTIAFWYNPDRIYNYNSVIDNSGHHDQWEMWISQGSNLNVRITGNSGRVTYPFTERARVDSWCHIAITWQRQAPDNYLRLYLNGEEVGKTAIDSWATPGTMVGFGGMNSGNNAGEAKFGDIRIYEEALSAREIRRVHGVVGARYPVVDLSLDSEEGGAANLGFGGADYDATLHGDPVYTNGWGLQGSSLYLDGVDDLVEVPYRLNGSGTIGFWCYLEGPWYNFNSLFDNSVHGNSLECWVDSVANLNFRVEGSKEVNMPQRAGTNLGSNSNQWHYIVCTWDAGSEVSAIYVDGKLRGTAINNENDAGWRKAGTTFYLGGGHKDNQFGRFRVIDLQIYNAPMGASQVASMYQSWMSGEMLAYLPFNNTLENLASEREAVAVGDYSFAPGKIKRAIQFSEANPPGDGGSCVSVSNVLGSCMGTIAFWYYPTAPFYNFQPIFDNAVHDNKWESWIYDNGVLAARINNDHPGAGGALTYDLNKLQGGNTWYHIAYTWNLPKARTRLYIDGVHVASAKLEERGWVVPNPTLNFGSMHKSNRAANGRWDEARVYNYELEATDIQELLILPPPDQTLILIK